MENEKNFSNGEKYNRKNVDSIKRFLILVFLIMCVLPILFCLYLMVRLNHMEKKISEIADMISAKQETSANMEAKEQTSSLSRQDVMLLEADSDEDLEKLSVGQSDFLTQTQESDSRFMTADKETPSEEKKKVYLTFDDGPNDYTAEILDVLKEKNVKATFFVVYNDDESLWPMYNRIVDEGHTLAMHSYSHVYSTVYASEESFRQDVEMIHDFLYERTGVDCRLYRFPGGSSNTVSKVDIQKLIAILNEKGITYFDWNALSGDAVTTDKTADELNEMILGYVRANEGDSVVLLHDINTSHATVEGLSDLIDTLREEGYELCPIEEDTVPVQHVKSQNDR